MQKILQVLKSRTFWTLVAMFIINGVAGVHDRLPTEWITTVDGILSIAAVYFHVNPQRNYNE